MKTCFISCSFGKKLSSIPGPFKKIKNCDYFMFSDQSSLSHRDQSLSLVWDLINISDNPIIKNLNCNIRKSRLPKFLGWKILESMNKKYDAIYYCDSHWSPNNLFKWNKLSQKMINADFGFCQDPHHMSDCHDLGIARETRYIVQYKRDTQQNIDKTLDFFKTHYPSVRLDSRGYYENTMFGYDPNSPHVRAITEEFWDVYSTKDITYRDQPLWNLLLKKNKLTPLFEERIRKSFIQTGLYGNHNHTI